jgi:hypothetical protein
MGPTYLFLDTEWADAAGTELVSLALVSEDGLHRFYAECAQLPASPTPFVAEVVCPRLQRGETALDTTALREHCEPSSASSQRRTYWQTIRTTSACCAQCSRKRVRKLGHSQAWLLQ